jgi:sulfate adenylyltransferase
MIRPHGGTLVDRVLRGAERDQALRDAKNWPRIDLSTERAKDVENLAKGVYSPLTGFLGAADFESVLHTMRLTNDLPWTIPLFLDVSKETASTLRPGEPVALYYDDKPLARLHLEETFEWDRTLAAGKIFGTDSEEHPSVARYMKMKDVLLGGAIDLLNETDTPYDRFNLNPRETRVLFREKGWRTVVGFQTRNVPHIGHEYVQKTALTFVDGVFINPVIGRKKPGDFRDDVILETYETLINEYYLRDRAVMAIWQYEMKYGGPREAIHHSIVRKNFGCTHFIVGRDHAGVGGFYEPFAAQDIFESFPDLEIVPVFFKSFSYCTKCGSVVNEKTCPHPPEDHVNFSGTKIRAILQEGKVPDPLLMRPEVAKIILKYDNPFVT